MTGAELFPDPARYDRMAYRRCGSSGVRLPVISIGLWHHFGAADSFDNARAVVRHAFDRGITHIDLANNYGPPPGAAEQTFGEILRRDLAAHRDELVIATKAGFRMGPGPHGEGGSRKYLVQSLDASLKRLGLDHVDIYYHHCHDPHTPLEESMAALDHVVRSGRAIYAGISNYPAETTRDAAATLRRLGTPCLVHQLRCNLLDRDAARALLPALAELGIGGVVYSPLAQGLLSERYLDGTIPADSRAARSPFLPPSALTPEVLGRVRAWAAIARQRGQSVAQLALGWVLQQPAVASVVIGAGRPEQIDEAIAAIDTRLSDGELARIDAV